MYISIYFTSLTCGLVALSVIPSIWHLGGPHHVAAFSALTPRPVRKSSSLAMERRTLLSQIPFSLIGVATSTVMTTASFCSPASAYERRDVGGPDASPETKAMNLQAYETNNRLERDGVKLEVS